MNLPGLSLHVHHSDPDTAAEGGEASLTFIQKGQSFRVSFHLSCFTLRPLLSVPRMEALVRHGAFGSSAAEEDARLSSRSQR